MGYIGTIVLLYSALMTGIYMLTIIIRGWFPQKGYRRDALKGFTDPSWLMVLPLTIFSILTILLGVHAQPLLDLIYSIAAGTI